MPPVVAPPSRRSTCPRPACSSPSPPSGASASGEHLQDDLLVTWFLDVTITDSAFDASTVATNRQRLLEHHTAAAFFDAVLDEARRRKLLSDEHVALDGTLLESWAALKRFRPTSQAKADEHQEAELGEQRDDALPAAAGGRNPEVDFHGEQRSTATHALATDPDARLMRTGKGKEAKLCVMGHVLMEHRNGLAVDVLLTHATGTAEQTAAVRMLDRRPDPQRHGTVGADKAYDTRDVVADCRERGMTPQVTQNTSGRRSAIDRLTTWHAGYAISQRIRKRVEEIFGWVKTVGGGRKVQYIGLERNQRWAECTTATDNLVRMAKLEAIAT